MGKGHDSVPNHGYRFVDSDAIMGTGLLTRMPAESRSGRGVIGRGESILDSDNLRTCSRTRSRSCCLVSARVGAGAAVVGWVGTGLLRSQSNKSIKGRTRTRQLLQGWVLDTCRSGFNLIVQMALGRRR